MKKDKNWSQGLHGVATSLSQKTSGGIVIHWDRKKGKLL